MVLETAMAAEMEMATEMDSLESRISTRSFRWIHQDLEDAPWSRTPEVVVEMEIISQGSVVLPEPTLAAQASHRMDIRSHFLLSHPMEILLEVREFFDIFPLGDKFVFLQCIESTSQERQSPDVQMESHSRMLGPWAPFHSTGFGNLEFTD
jgi:hypothetical protein